MPDLTSVLASIPGYGAYIAKRQMNEQQGMQNLNQASSLVGLQQKMREQQQEQAFREGLAKLGPEATQEQLAQLAAQFSKPADVLRTQQSSLDRQATIEAARVNKEAALEQAKTNAQMQHELRMSRLKSDGERAVETERHNRAIEGIQAEMTRIRASSAEQGRTPAGYRKSADGNLEAIPGGPADSKLQGQLNTDTASLSTTTANMDRLATAANEVMSHPGLGGITGKRGMIPNVPGSAAANAQAKLDTLKAQVGFGVLQELRNTSKTGGALGQVTEKEHALLQNALAALQNAQSEEQMKESLQKIIDYTTGAKERLRAAYNMKHGDKGGGAGPAAPTQPGAPGGFQEGQTATGPNGQKIIFKGGVWQPATSQ